MFLFFSVISLPCNFCQIQPASELGSPSTTELISHGEYIFVPPHSPFQNYARRSENIFAMTDQFCRGTDAGLYLAEIARQGNDREEQEHE